MIPRLDISFPRSQQRAFIKGEAFISSEGDYLLNHARSGIYLALKALQLPKGSSVGVMTYNCHTVMESVRQAGCKVFFLDVTDDLLLDMVDLKRKVNRLSAIVVTHLFGVVNDVKRIREAFPGLPIIEDCAHAFGIEDLHGDFASFSIGQGKLPSIGDGGILKVLNRKYLEKVSALYNALPGYSSSQDAKLFIKLWTKSLMHNRLIYGWITLPLKKCRRNHLGKEPVVPRKMSRGISAIYSKESDSVACEIAHRKNRAQVLIASLPKGVSYTILGSNAFMLVLFCDNPKLVRDYYCLRGLDTDTHFAQCIHWAQEFGYVSGQCPNAEKLVNHLLMVPLYSKR